MAKSTLPKSVRIGAFDYSIVPLTPQVEEEEGLYGDIQFSKTQIRIRESVSPKVKAETLLHEILHGCFANGFLKTDDEEQIVCVVSVQLCQVIRDNPKVIDYISKSLRDNARS